MTHPNQHPTNQDSTFLYPAEDAQQILSIAMACQTESGDLSRAQLLEIAEELGISAETLAEAEREWDVKKYELADQRQFDRERKQRFQHSLSRFCFFIGFLFVLLILAGGSGGWAGLANFLLFLPGAPWGLKLAWDAWRIYRPNEYSYTKEFQRWRRKQQMRRAVGGAVRRLMGSF
ncbi:hypothetical protein GFS31_02300 [Leptolyngbya sp. BL0902]|uniref:2TM domain-containing protein n=1 Tax=Leptolyngbya sp. BL0902 TaxID=1115757 RepID=UPI0018E7CC43|nr:2TM domain-containing protein [Leptolyngbya sp. BL0902]QQE63563.1 hypothetical protein GFS31_02300 [Leptolyngbya sp. BL0902]